MAEDKPNKIALAEITNSLSIPKAVDGSKVMTLKRELGFGVTLKIIIALISDVNNFFSLADGKKMNDDQMIDTAQILMEDYKIFSLEDFALAFKEGKKGKYGKIYSAIDGHVIIGWLRAYDIERDEALAKLNSYNAPKEPVIPLSLKDDKGQSIAEKLYEAFAKPVIEEKEKAKMDEDEFRKQRAKYLADKAAKAQKENLQTPEL